MIHKLSAACYALWSMFHISNTGIFQSIYFATWDEASWGGGARLTVKMYLHYTGQLLGLCLLLNLQINVAVHLRD